MAFANNLKSLPNSHIQLLVPMSYEYGGAITDEATTANAFDGDVDSSIQLPATSVVKWTYPAAVSYPTVVGTNPWMLIYRHYGDNSCVYKVTFDATDCVLTQGFIEEDRGQVARDWTNDGDVFNRDNSSSAFSNLLVECAASVGSYTIHRFNITTGSASSNVREVIFSKDYTVPMYSKSMSSSYYFTSQTGKTKTGIQSPRFNLRNSYVMAADHSFEWNELTDAEKLVFEYFFKAFGGNITRPCAMCVIHGTPTASETINNVMTTRMLVINEGSVKWSRNKQTLRHNLNFNATELIPL